MSVFSEDDNLSLACLILCLDALLQLKHHGTGGIDDLDVVTTGEFIGLGGLAMCTQQHLDIVEFTHLVVIDGDKSHLTKTLTLHAVMNDIAKAVEGLALSKLCLGFLDGSRHAEAEATAFIYFYLNH